VSATDRLTLEQLLNQLDAFVAQPSTDAKGELIELYRLYAEAKRSRSSTTMGDRIRVDIQLEVLHLVWERDGLTGRMAKEIVLNDDASLRQKLKALYVWFGFRPDLRK
jgi:hypothetical protein